VVTVNPTAEDRGVEGSSFADALGALWPRLGEGPGPPRLRLMKTSSRPGRYLPILFFLFREGADVPSYALKVNRDPGYPDAVLREFRNYSAIWARGGGEEHGMPRPVFCERVGDHVVLCETYVRGRRCEDRYFSVRRGGARRRAIERFLTAAMAWARDFHRRTRVASAPIDAARLEAEFRRPLRAFAARADVTPALGTRLVAFADRLTALAGQEWPRAAVHGDFDHGNILLDGDRVGVIDWEDCEPIGNPFVDLAYLIVHLALVSDLAADADRRLAAFFAPGSWSLGLVRALVADYAAAHGLAPEAFFLGLPGVVVEILSRPWGIERDPRSIQLHSLPRLGFLVDLAEREARAA
jgi:aminoglycoside phosphotransferase (APT) family kinase protein